MLHVNRRRGVRLLALAAIATQVLVLLVSPLLVPVGTAAIVGGVGAVRLLQRDADGAVLRLGLGFVVSLLTTYIGLLSGAMGLFLPALLSSTLFGLAWRRMHRLAHDERTAWGIDYRHRVAQRPEEHLRRVEPPAPFVPPAAAGSSAPGAGFDVAIDPAEDDWWEQLD